MCNFALLMCRPSCRVMYGSGLPLEYEALVPLSPVIALGGCSWSVHPSSLLTLPSSQDGSTGVKETQLIITWRTCRKWPAVGLLLMLVVRRYACMCYIWCVTICNVYATLEVSPIRLLKEWYINTNTLRTILKEEFHTWKNMVSMVIMYTLVYEVTCFGGSKLKCNILQHALWLLKNVLYCVLSTTSAILAHFTIIHLSSIHFTIIFTIKFHLWECAAS